MAKIARRDGQHFDCVTQLHKARKLPKEGFRREVEKELTGREEEPSELIYFKVYKSQIPVIEQAIETAALLLRFFLALAHPASIAWREISCHYQVRLPRRARTFAKVRKETFAFSHKKPGPVRKFHKRKLSVRS